MEPETREQPSTTTSMVLSPHERRRQGLWFVLKSTLLSIAVVVGYFVLPLTTSLATDTILKLLLGLLLISVLLAWNIREILRSPFPGARAVGALLLAIPLFLTLFATSYYLMGDAEPSAFSEPLTRLDALYFTVTTFATVGFGDITAVSEAARAVATGQMIVGLVLVGLIARVLLGAVEHSRNRLARSYPRRGPD